MAVAALAALESLLSATVADGMSVGQRHDPDRELLGQGIANLAAPLFGGIPATAAIARTAVNVRSGAASRLASVSHAVVLLIVVLVIFLAGLRQIPVMYYEAAQVDGCTQFTAFVRIILPSAAPGLSG